MTVHPQRIHIMGSSGSGTSTLGRVLSLHLGMPYLDSDDFVWQMLPQPYSYLRPPQVRRELLQQYLKQFDTWIISGALCGWGNDIIPQLDCVIYLSAPSECCVERIKRRDLIHFGKRILHGGDLKTRHDSFVYNASNYMNNNCNVRSQKRHEAWLKTLPCSILRVDASKNFNVVFEDVDKQLRAVL